MQNLHKEETIERYLEEVRSRLNILSEAERDAELAEVRSHLLALAQAHTELGIPEQEAMQAALQQFGDPKSVGTGLRRAWKQGLKQRLPGTVLSAAGWAFSISLSSSLIINLLLFMLAWLTHGYEDLGTMRPDLFIGLSVIIRLQNLFAGYMTGLKAPRRAYAGMLLISALFTGLNTVFVCRYNLPHMRAEVVADYWRSMAIALGISWTAMFLGVSLGRKQFLARQRRKLASV